MALGTLVTNHSKHRPREAALFNDQAQATRQPTRCYVSNAIRNLNPRERICCPVAWSVWLATSASIGEVVQDWIELNELGCDILQFLRCVVPKYHLYMEPILS